MGSLVRRTREECECRGADCKQFFKCVRHLGKECKHLGGDKIPKERADIWDMPKALGQ